MKLQPERAKKIEQKKVRYTKGNMMGIKLAERLKEALLKARPRLTALLKAGLPKAEPAALLKTAPKAALPKALLLPLLPLLLLPFLSACSSDELGSRDEGAVAEEREMMVDFDAYILRTTRSGATGALTLDGASGTTSLQTKGFGVLGYDSGTEFYSQLSIPDFMYNDHVTYNGERWSYSPYKYWPNGEGEAAGVTGIIPHYVSFFGYAPWVNVDETTGIVASGGGDDEYSATNGIYAITRNVKTGDPYVFYNVSFDPMSRVDLCWATPQLNKTKPLGNATDEASLVNMQFHHALAALNVQIDSDVRQNQDGGVMNLEQTRIWVRSISLQGVTTKGVLNLNNATTTPLWLQLDGFTSLSVKPITVDDGRRDLYEGLLADPNETTVGLNPELVQSEPYTIVDGAITVPTQKGVTTTTVNLFGEDADGTARTRPVYVIPTAAPLRVAIVYDVETYDPKLKSEWLADGKTHGSSIRNNIWANISLGTIEAGKHYTLRLHLGVASVEATASVTEWQEGETVNVEVPE